MLSKSFPPFLRGNYLLKVPGNGDCLYHTVLSFLLGRNLPAGHEAIGKFRHRLMDLVLENKEKVISDRPDGPHLIFFSHKAKENCCELWKSQPKNYHNNFLEITSSLNANTMRASCIEEWAECHRKDRTWGDDKILGIIAGLTGFSFFSYNGNVAEDNDSPFFLYNSRPQYGFKDNIPGGEVWIKYQYEHYGLIIPNEKKIQKSVSPYLDRPSNYVVDVEMGSILEEKNENDQLEKKIEMESIVNEKNENVDLKKRKRQGRLTNYFTRKEKVPVIVVARQADASAARRIFKNFEYKVKESSVNEISNKQEIICEQAAKKLKVNEADFSLQDREETLSSSEPTDLNAHFEISQSNPLQFETILHLPEQDIHFEQKPLEKEINENEPHLKENEEFLSNSEESDSDAYSFDDKSCFTDSDEHSNSDFEFDTDDFKSDYSSGDENLQCFGSSYKERITTSSNIQEKSKVKDQSTELTPDINPKIDNFSILQEIEIADAVENSDTSPSTPKESLATTSIIVDEVISEVLNFVVNKKPMCSSNSNLHLDTDTIKSEYSISDDECVDTLRFSNEGTISFDLNPNTEVPKNEKNECKTNIIKSHNKPKQNKRRVSNNSEEKSELSLPVNSKENFATPNAQPIYVTSEVLSPQAMHKSKLSGNERTCPVCQIKVKAKFFRKHLNKHPTPSDFKSNMKKPSEIKCPVCGDPIKITKFSKHFSKHSKIPNPIPNTTLKNDKHLEKENLDTQILCHLCGQTVNKSFIKRHMERMHKKPVEIGPKDNGNLQERHRQTDYIFNENMEQVHIMPKAKCLNGQKSKVHIEANKKTTHEREEQSDPLNQKNTQVKFAQDEDESHKNEKQTDTYEQKTKVDIDTDEASNLISPVNIAQDEENSIDSNQNSENLEPRKKKMKTHPINEPKQKAKKPKKFKKQKYNSLDRSVTCRVCDVEILEKNYKRHLQHEHHLSGENKRVKNQRSIGEMIRNPQASEETTIPKSQVIADNIDENQQRTEENTLPKPQGITNNQDIGKEILTEPKYQEKSDLTQEIQSIKNMLNILVKDKEEKENKRNEEPKEIRESTRIGQICPELDRCRTLEDILVALPFMEVKEGHVQCSLCVSTSAMFMFKWENSWESTSNKMSTEFSNFKGILKGHLNTKKHKFEKNKAEIVKKEEPRQITVGMNMTRTYHKMIITGEPDTHLESELMLQHQNGVDIGDIGHGRKIISEIIPCMAQDIRNSIETYLKTPLKQTTFLPTGKILADSSTKHHRQREFVAFSTVIADSEELIRAIHFPIIIQKDGKGITQKNAILQSLKLETENIVIKPEQYLGTSGDGHFQHCSVHQYMDAAFKVSRHHDYDPMHKAGRQDIHIRKAEEFKWLTRLTKNIGGAYKFAKMKNEFIEFYEFCQKYIEDPKYPETKFYEIAFYNECRFANSTCRVYRNAYEQYSALCEKLEKAIEDRRGKTDKKNQEIARKASGIANFLHTVLNATRLAGIADVYDVLGTALVIVQKVNYLPHERKDEFLKAVKKLDVMCECIHDHNICESTKEVEKCMWPRLHAQFTDLKQGIFKNKVLAAEQPEANRAGLRSEKKSTSENQVTQAVKELEKLTKSMHQKLKENVYKKDDQDFIEKIRAVTDLKSLTIKCNQRSIDSVHNDSINGFITNAQALTPQGKDIPEDTLRNQYKLFLEKIVDMNSGFETVLSSKKIIANLLKSEDKLYEGIEKVMYVITTAAVLTGIESIIESHISIFNARRDGRPITEKRAANEVMIKINGPDLSENEDFLRRSVEKSKKQWHYIRQTRNVLSYNVSKVIDRKLSQKSPLPFTV